MKDKRELLGITRLLTEGVVAGNKSWTTPKRPKQPDLDVLFAKTKLQNKDMLTPSDGSTSATNGQLQDMELCGTDGTTIIVDKTVELLSDSDVSDDEHGEKKNLQQDSQSGVTSDFRNPKAWELYYRNLERMGRDLADKCGWAHFDRVFMVSALNGDGIFDLKVTFEIL